MTVTLQVALMSTAQDQNVEPFSIFWKTKISVSLRAQYLAKAAGKYFSANRSYILEFENSETALKIGRRC